MSYDKCQRPCNHHHNQVIKYIHHPKKFPRESLQSALSPHPQSWQPLTRFLSPQFTFSRMLCKRNHSVCSLLCLTSSTEHDAFQIHLCYRHVSSFFSFLSLACIPQCGYIPVVCLLFVFVFYMFTGDRWTGLFPALVIMNKEHH